MTKASTVNIFQINRIKKHVAAWGLTHNVFCAAAETLVQWTNDANKMGKHLSEPFHVTNGVRQGGVLNPYLFAVYLDDLSIELNNIKAGCYIDKVLLNHLIFADDIVRFVHVYVGCIVY